MTKTPKRSIGLALAAAGLVSAALISGNTAPASASGLTISTAQQTVSFHPVNNDIVEQSRKKKKKKKKRRFFGSGSF